MPLYNYKATGTKAKPHKGQIEAEDERRVGSQLREQGLTPLSIIEAGKERPVDNGGLVGKLGIIGVSFLVGAGLILIKRDIREPILKKGPGMLFGVAAGTGVVAALIAALFTLVEAIESAGKRRLAMVGGVIGITILILVVLMVLADILGW
ncbi:MAG: hypothetical protein AAF711_11300 [Planctomycetota bacterium]